MSFIDRRRGRQKGSEEPVRKYYPVLGAIALIATLGAAPASAASEVRATNHVQACVDQVEALQAAGRGGGLSVEYCAVETRIEVGEPYVVGVEEARLADLPNEEKDRLMAAVGSRAVTGRHYSQFTNGAAYSRTQNGTWYFDGTYSWVTQTRDGLTGSHSCFTNYAIEVNVSGVSCTDTGTDTERYVEDQYQVTVGPITYGYSMKATLFADGNVSGFGATTG
jgi:hypothetical protein